MKHGKKSIVLSFIAVLLAAAIAFPQQSFAASDAKKPTATKVQYVTENGKRTGIRSFTIEPFTYYNLSQDTVINKDNARTLKLNDAKLLQIAKRQIFPKWSVIAEGVFRDQADQLVTIEGSGMMSSSTTSSNSFDRHFSTSKVSNGYTDDWAVSDLAQALSQETSSHNGKRCWDETRITGVTQIGNLNDARTLMGQELRNCSDDNDVSKDDFLGNGYQKSEDKRRLPDLEDDKTGEGFANIVTCVNRAGASGDYDYVSFGIAVYDFDITPVAAENLKYIETADEEFTDDTGTVKGKDILMGLAGDHVNKTGISFHNDDTDGTTSYLRNNTTQEVTQSSGLENSVTEENTISTDDTFEWGMEQTVGSELNLGGHGDGNCMFPRVTLSFSNSWHELWSTTRGKSDTKSTSKTRNTNTEVTLPGHTVAVVRQSLNNKKTTEQYQQPVVLNYKVAIFAMSGDYFNGSEGGIENSRYDKQWMSVIFDGSDDSETSGCDALGSLYNRAVTNKETQGYDGSKGRYRSWCDKSAWNKSSKINWENVSTTFSGDNRSSHRIPLSSGRAAINLRELATELPLIEKAQILSSKRESITSSVEEIIPLYSLGSIDIKTGAKEYDLVPRDTLYLDSIELEGYDREGAEFYDFDKNCGEWVLLNDDEIIIEDNSDEDESDVTGEVRSGAVTIVNNTTIGSQKVEIAADAESANETHYLKWRLKPYDKNDSTTIITSNEELNRPEGSDAPSYMTDEEKAGVDTPTILINIKDRENDIVNFETSGTYKCPWNETVNLGHIFTADAVDASGKIRGVSVFWESKGTSGINVDRSGETTFTKKGTYKVRPFCYNMDGKKIVPVDSSQNPVWLEVIARDKATLGSIVINKPERSDAELTLSEDTASLGFDLGSYTSFFDQYGDRWEGTDEEPLPEVRYSVSGPNGAFIDGEDILTISRPGTYTVNAKAYDQSGNSILMTIDPIKITVTEQDRLASVTMDEPALSRSERTLKNEEDCIVVQNLKGLLTYSDQNGDEWTGKKPNVTFSIEGNPKNAEIKGGNFYAYAPGTYTIKPSASGYKINSVSIVVEEDQNLVLKVEDPGKQYLYTDGDEIELELERYINATTRYGGKWKGKVPELKFTLTDANGASIEERTVYDGDDDYDGSYRHYFRTNVTGEYFVHVEAKKSSDYTEPIDDIFIRVVKGKKVARIEFKDIEADSDMKDFMVDYYGSEYPTIDLSKYLNYYDGFGEPIDPAQDHVRIPDCEFALLNPDETAGREFEINGPAFTAYTPGFYFIEASMNVTNNDPSDEEPKEDTLLKAVTGFMIYDIGWLHSFTGEWETSDEGMDSICTNDITRVRHCDAGEGCINHESGECDAVITDTIPATGHKWAKYYKINASEHYLYTYCEICGEINEDSITHYSGSPDNGMMDDETPNPYKPASCTEEGIYRCDGELVTVPAVGHSWSTGFIEERPASCHETGLESIQCDRCNAVREGEAYQRIIPKLEHVPDEAHWTYATDEEGNEYRETCEEPGVKVTDCVHGCGENLYDFIPAKGHDWGDGAIETEPSCTVDGVRKYTCSHDSSHTKTEFIPATGHAWGKATLTKATPDKDGAITKVCGNCGEKDITLIAHPRCSLTKKTYVYNGKARKPAVKVTDAKGKTIAASNYTVTYSNNVKAGKKAIAKVTFKGNSYSGSKSFSFTISKAANPLSVKAKTATVKLSNVKKKAQKLGVTKVIKFTKKGQGKMTYTLSSAKNGSKSFKKYFKINKKTGMVTIQKNKKMKKGTYTVKVKVKAAGNANYKASAVKTVTFKVKVN